MKIPDIIKICDKKNVIGISGEVKELDKKMLVGITTDIEVLVFLVRGLTITSYTDEEFKFMLR